MYRKRTSLKRMNHILEHLDSAFTSMSLGMNLLLKLVKEERKRRRKDDKIT